MPVRALARVNLAAIERNVGVCGASCRPAHALCAVVKADGYGHGAVHSARAALAGGATWLAVATATEAAELRDGGLEGPILVMGASATRNCRGRDRGRGRISSHGASFVDRPRGGPANQPLRVDVKFDTGMGRLGTREEGGRSWSRRSWIARVPLVGAMTHFATRTRSGVRAACR